MTHLLDGTKDVHLTKDMFMRSILPIGLLFSGSLILSNTAHLYLSVAYIQMLNVHPRCYHPYLVVLPDPRAQPQADHHRLPPHHTATCTLALLASSFKLQLSASKLRVS